MIQTANTTGCFCGKELDLGIWFVGIDKTSWMHLDLLKVDSASTDDHGRLLTYSSTMVVILGAMFLQQ